MLQRLSSGELIRWEPTTFRQQGLKEADLEDIIEKQPGLIAVLDGRVRFPKWRAFRQVRFSRMGWKNRIDLLLFSDEGQISVVEVKLNDNTDLRNPREVLAQVIDYAAGFALLSQAELEQALGVGSLADELSKDFTDVPDIRRLIDLLMRRLREGEIDLVIACDGAPVQFEDWISRISAQQSLAFRLRLVELRCYTAPGQGIMMAVEHPLTTQIIGRTIVTVRQESDSSRVSVEIAPPSAESLQEEADSLNIDGKRRRPKKRPWLQRTAELLGESEEKLVADLMTINKRATASDWRFVADAIAVDAEDFDPHDPWPSGRWGCLGIGLLYPWRPGVFLGVIYDGSAPMMEPIVDGAEFGLILNLWGADGGDKNGPLVPGYTTTQYRESEEYQSLCGRLSQLDGPWFFENNLLKKKRNVGSPLDIRRSLADLFEGTSSLDERFERWLAAAREACEMLLAGGELQSLRDKMVKSFVQDNREE